MGLALPTRSATKQSDSSRAWGAMYKAVNYSPRLNKNEKAVINHLTMHLNVKKKGRDTRWAKIATIALSTGLSSRTVLRTIKQLVENGYLLKELRFEHGRKAPSNFTLTNKVFDEYKDAKEEKRPKRILRQCDNMVVSQCDNATDDSSSNQKEVNKPNNLGITQSDAPNVTPIETKRREGTRLEARRIINGSLDIRDGDFVPQCSINGFTDSLLDRFGIHPFRAFKSYLEREGLYGRCAWKPKSVERWIADFASSEGKA